MKKLVLACGLLSALTSAGALADASSELQQRL
ncbi:MAG: outer-membrane lipoprotein carrier protein LolA, partial [Pantoea sp.]|nr:outer-membrane lipoprotein carrier protein LolA [Pantoea sp.]